MGLVWIITGFFGWGQFDGPSGGWLKTVEALCLGEAANSF
jgi:hypothetical protein